MTVTGPWLRLDEKDDWHFCLSCHFYPTTKDVEVSYARPIEGSICIWCRGQVARSTCT